MSERVFTRTLEEKQVVIPFTEDALSSVAAVVDVIELIVNNGLLAVHCASRVEAEVNLLPGIVKEEG